MIGRERILKIAMGVLDTGVCFEKFLGGGGEYFLRKGENKIFRDLA